MDTIQTENTCDLNKQSILTRLKCTLMWLTQKYKQWWLESSRLIYPVWLLSVWNTASLQSSSQHPPPPHPLPLLESSGAGLTRAVLQLAALACVQEHKACQWRTAVCQPFEAEGEGALGVSQRAWEPEPDSPVWRTASLKAQTAAPSPSSGCFRCACSCRKTEKKKKRSFNFPSKLPAPAAWVWAGLPPVTHVQ